MGWATAAQVGMQVLGGIMAHNAKKRQARKQAWANYHASLEMFGQLLQTYKEIGQQQLAANEQSAENNDSFSLEAARREATAKVQSDATGVGGSAQDGILRDLARQNAQHAYANKQSLHYSTLQIQNQYTAANMRYQGQLSSAPDIQKPSDGFLAASIGGAVAQGAASYFGSK